MNLTASPVGSQPFLLSPAGLDLRDVFPARLRKHVDAARRVVHVISLGGVRRRRVDRDKDRLVPLSQADGITLTGSRWAWDIVRTGLKQGVIECDDHYIIGEKPLNYRIHRQWEKSPLKPFKTKDPLEEGRIAWAFLERRRLSHGPRLPVHGFLKEWVQRFSLDAEVVADALAVIREQGNPERLNYAERVVSLVASGGRYGRYTTVCEFGRRFHSIVTRMPRALRRAIRIDGMPLVERDICGSQPLILGSLAVAKQRAKTRAESPELPTLPQRRGREEEGEGLSSITWLVFAPSADEEIDDWMQIPDLSDYMNACTAGRYYEELGVALGTPCRTPSIRDMVKLESNRIIFGRHRPRSARWRAFSGRWPTVARHLAELKRGDYLNAARTLQRLEAEIMIEGVCGELMELHADSPLLTIHDSVMVPASSVEYGIRRDPSGLGSADGVPAEAEVRWAVADQLRPGAEIRTTHRLHAPTPEYSKSSLFLAV